MPTAVSRYITLDQAASITRTPESRWRGSYRQNSIAVPALTRGEYQVTRAAVVRAAVLIDLQRVFGEQAAICLKLAKALTDEQCEHLLVTDDPTLTVIHDQPERDFKIGLDPEWLATVREGLEQVPA
jgi:hypothetical protein